MAIEYAQKNFEFLCLYGFRHISKVIHISSSVVWGHITEVGLRESIMLLKG